MYGMRLEEALMDGWDSNWSRHQSEQDESEQDESEQDESEQDESEQDESEQDESEPRLTQGDDEGCMVQLMATSGKERVRISGKRTRTTAREREGPHRQDKSGQQMSR
ncbi:uncharacterized protein UHOD_07686 [Ustilago sp. UG-2017b]|nr:uncharacterized protein UHOD_07686 [Ustilago sp. UG-2017b]